MIIVTTTDKTVYKTTQMKKDSLKRSNIKKEKRTNMIAGVTYVFFVTMYPIIEVIKIKIGKIKKISKNSMFHLIRVSAIMLYSFYHKTKRRDHLTSELILSIFPLS